MNQDKDLTFLVTCNNEDLRTLCDILTYITTICEQTTSKLSDEELRNLADKAGIPHKSHILFYVLIMTN